MWKIVQCAVQGRSHVKNNIPCQDKTFSIERNGTTVIALADGAGSAKWSHYGADRITRFICEDCTENFDVYYGEKDGVSVKTNIVMKIDTELTHLSEKIMCEKRDLASTLLFVAIKEGRFIIAHIGDGVIGYLKNAELKVASQPENGEFVNTTVFTTSKDVLYSMKIIKGELGDINGFVLMSDGTEASLYDKRKKKLADILKKVMDFCAIIPPDKIEEQLKNSFETIIKQATMDDCSIVFMVEDRGNFLGYKNLSIREKVKLLDIPCSATKKRVKRYDKILSLLEREKSLYEVSRGIHLRTKYTKKYLNKLLKLNLIEKRGEKYQTIIIMEY